VVDTKNFAVQTGVRTFEAAAYLRRSGADPAIVRHLFRVDMENLKLRAAILAGSQSLPGGVVIATCPGDVKDSQIISAQAADTMLTIEGVRVSFVLCPTEEGVSISARSDGDVNVQVIMEAFGGGGHQTVAGAQLDGVDVAEARRRLEAVIFDYIGEETEYHESGITGRSKKLGKKGDFWRSRGVRRNFVAKKLAAPATRYLNSCSKEAAAATAETATGRGQAVAAQLAKIEVKVAAKAGEGGKLFGAVTTKDIADAAKAQHGIELDRRKMEIPEAIKNMGPTTVVLKLHPEVTAEIKILVVGE
jgi:ribosomal protein L9